MAERLTVGGLVFGGPGRPEVGPDMGGQRGQRCGCATLERGPDAGRSPLAFNGLKIHLHEVPSGNDSHNDIANWKTNNIRIYVYVFFFCKW